MISQKLPQKSISAKKQDHLFNVLLRVKLQRDEQRSHGPCVGDENEPIYE